MNLSEKSIWGRMLEKASLVRWGGMLTDPAHTVAAIFLYLAVNQVFICKTTSNFNLNQYLFFLDFK